MSRADLHVHSTASDGTMTPTQVVEEAARAGLSAVALADHDTINGTEEALAAGSRLGVTVVPSLELSSEFGPVEVHVLGYFIDWGSEKLQKKLERLRRGRLDRAKKIVEKLNEAGVSVTLERVLEIAGSGSVGRPHIAQALCEAGVVNSLNAAFGRYLVRGAPAFVERMKLSPYDAIGMIIDAGGVASLAHPSKTGRDELIMEFVKVGLGAIEVYHTDQSSPDVTRHYQALARRYSLIATGGSDAHGFGPEGQSLIGSVTVEASVVDQLREAAQGSYER